MMLGDLLSQAQGSAAVLPQALREEIAAAGAAPEGFARAAVAAFERRAGPEEWAQLVTRMRESPDPGGACLETMCRWYLQTLNTGRTA
jgi:hypothetical protein